MKCHMYIALNIDRLRSICILYICHFCHSFTSYVTNQHWSQRYTCISTILTFIHVIMSINLIVIMKMTQFWVKFNPSVGYITCESLVKSCEFGKTVWKMWYITTCNSEFKFHDCSFLIQKPCYKQNKTKIIQRKINK